ncbi:MAG: hypothetical protein IJA74_05350 [Oscillospiraceae bacterium]|nr:hypothetical protein [Oscillospiraceae bacterium]
MFEINEFDYVNRGRYVFERFSEESRRLINQTSVRSRMAPLPEGDKSNACWDGIVAPDGKFYFPLSSESGLCAATKLGWFDYDNDRVVVVCDAEEALLSNDRKLPHSKFHTSLNAIPRNALYPEEPYDPMDYLIVGLTHSTDRAKHHKEWMPFGHHNHVWEGFPGGQIIVYDPKSGHCFSLGTPVPQETIYGAKYDPKHNRLYMIGFMRGHVYCYDFKERRVIKDLGKAAEIFCYRLVLGADGHIYGCSKSGQLFKVNTDTVELENLDWHVPDFKDNYVSYTFYRYMVQGRNHPSGKYLYFAISNIPWMYKLEFATGKTSCIGRAVPLDGIYELPAKNADFGVHAFDFDKEGVMWLAVKGGGGMGNHPFWFAHLPYLVRWDPDNGEAPFVCGLFGRPERLQHYITEMEYDHVNDRLYWVDQVAGTNMRPSAGALELSQFRKVYRERGPVSEDEYTTPVYLTEEELQAREEAKKKPAGGEENARLSPFHAFHPSKVEAIRIWRSLPRLEVEDSKVIGMAFDKKTKDTRYKLHVVTGRSGEFDTAAFVLQIVDKEVVSVQRMGEIDDKYRKWLKENILPQPFEFDENIKLPEVTGRRYRAKASCVVDWKDGKKMVGTLDAILSIVSPDGSVYSLGNASAYGPIRGMVTNKDKTHLWGIAGDDEDLGYVFQYDEVNGLRQMGIINYNIPGYFDGPTVANVLSGICLSPDEKYLAIGSADRIAEVHVMDIQ